MDTDKLIVDFISNLNSALILLHQGHFDLALFRLDEGGYAAKTLEVSGLLIIIGSAYCEVATNRIDEAIKELEELQVLLINSDNSILEELRKL